MPTALEESPFRWYQGLDRYCWIVLIIAALGWLFDTMDQNLYSIVRAPSLTVLLKPQFTNVLGVTDTVGLTAAVKAKGGLITAIFLLGWSAGGFFFGILGDRLGRTRTMILTILIYAVFTGLSGLVQSWEMYAVTRFLTALGVGGEWAAGAALVAETFPQRSRPMALGFLQALSAVGNMVAALVTLSLGNLEANWRWAYFVGALPAFLVIWISRSVEEPQKWKDARQRASMEKELGSIGQLFSDPVLRRNTIAATLMATAGVAALWGVGFFSADMLREQLLKIGIVDKTKLGHMSSAVFLVQQIGAFFGIYLFAVFAERFSRRSAFSLWFLLAWPSILAYFWGVAKSGQSAFPVAMLLAPIMGFCTLGPFSGFTIYFPELFPTRLRATGCGFCYNAARVFAAGAPFALGSLAGKMGGYAPAATVVTSVYLLGFVGAWLGPETKGMPLPE